MFGKRADGKAVKGLNPFYRIIPYIMKKRSDSQVFCEDRIYLDNINEYNIFIIINSNCRSVSQIWSSG